MPVTSRAAATRSRPTLRRVAVKIRSRAFLKSIELLEPVLQKHPRFLWGLNDVAGFYLFLAMYQQLHGLPQAKESFEKTLLYERSAAALMKPTSRHTPTSCWRMPDSLATRAAKPS